MLTRRFLLVATIGSSLSSSLHAAEDTFGRRVNGLAVLKEQNAYFEQTFASLVNDPESYLKKISELNARINAWIVAWSGVDAHAVESMNDLKKISDGINGFADKQLQDIAGIRVDLNKLSAHFDPIMDEINAKKLKYPLQGYGDKQNAYQATLDAHINALKNATAETQALLSDLEKVTPQIADVYKEKVKAALINRQIANIDEVLATIDGIFKAKIATAGALTSVKIAFAEFNAAYMDSDYFRMKEALKVMANSCSAYDSATQAFASIPTVVAEKKVITGICAQPKNQFDQVMADYGNSVAAISADMIEYTFSPLGRALCEAKSYKCEKVKTLLAMKKDKIKNLDDAAVEKLVKTWKVTLGRGK